MIGIYKITNPKGKIYIGQSISIERRFKAYFNLNCKKQIILYNSFLKYGVKNHIFETICECDISELNDKERYYQDLFLATSSSGLNCVLTVLDGNKRKQFFKDKKERYEEKLAKLKRKEITDVLDSIMFKI